MFKGITCNIALLLFNQDLSWFMMRIYFNCMVKMFSVYSMLRYKFFFIQWFCVCSLKIWLKLFFLLAPMQDGMQTAHTPVMWARICRTRQPRSLCPGWKWGEEEENREKLPLARETHFIPFTKERDTVGPSYSIIPYFIRNCGVIAKTKCVWNKSLLNLSTVM